MLHLARKEVVTEMSKLDDHANKRVADLLETLALMSGANSAIVTAPSLESLIETHQLAAAAYEAAMEVEDEIETAYKAGTSYEMVFPLSIGEGRSLYLRSGDLDKAFDDCRGGIIRAYDGHIQKLAGLRRAAPDLAKTAIAKLKTSQAADIRFLKKLVANERARRDACGLNKAVNDRATASNFEDKALTAICSYRCATIEQCQAKAAYLLTVVNRQLCELPQEDVIALLQSFAPAAH